MFSLHHPKVLGEMVSHVPVSGGKYDVCASANRRKKQDRHRSNNRFHGVAPILIHVCSGVWFIGGILSFLFISSQR